LALNVELPEEEALTIEGGFCLEFLNAQLDAFSYRIEDVLVFEGVLGHLPHQLRAEVGHESLLPD